MSATIPILIVGAGPTGLVVALSLIQSGTPFRIIERSKVTHQSARGTALQPRSLELLRQLGASDDVLSIATPPLQMRVYDGKNVLKTFEWSVGADESPGVPHRFMASLSQSRLEGIVRAHLEKLGGKVEMGTELVSIAQSEDKVSVRVLVDGQEESIECDYVVAADGAKGRTRGLLGVPFLGKSKEFERMLTADVEAHGVPDRDHWHRWGDGSEAMISLKPLNPAPCYQVQSLGPGLPKTFPKDAAELQALFNSISQRDDIKITAAGEISEWRANIRMIDRYSVGRVFFAGDCAHCHSPAGGQGTNTAMQDAANLAWKLSLVHNGSASPSLLSTYETERMPVAAEMLNLSTIFHAHAFRAHASSHQNQQAPKPVVPQDPLHRPKSLLQLGINYRWSPIVLDERNGHDAAPPVANAYGDDGDPVVRAGDRAPDAPELDEGNGGPLTTLFDVFASIGRLHVIILFLRQSLPLDEVSAYEKMFASYKTVARGIVISRSQDMHGSIPGAARHLVDTKGYACTGYGVDDDRNVIVVVRPDGVVGAYVSGLAGVEAYFKRVLTGLP